MNTWKIDGAHSEIAFKIRHLGISNVRGTFNNFDATLTASDDTFSDAKISFTAETKSVDTRQEHRDAHLLTPDFFDVEKFPTLNFESTSFTKTGENTFDIKGKLTLKSTTKEILLKAVLNGFSTSIDGKRNVGFEVTGKIDRKEMNFIIPSALDTTLGNEISFEANVEFKLE